MTPPHEAETEAETPTDPVKCADCGAEMPQPWEGSRVALLVESPGEPPLELEAYACQPACLYQAVAALARTMSKAYAS